ncbi:MAG: DUF2069 domain-containing protein [Rubrivivax sp.]|nr:DUF2069 domain-containing protein [Rubrivivax sp.]
MGAPARPSAAVALAGRAVLALLCMLAGLGLAWELWLAPIGRGTLALKVLPLLLALPGLLRHRLYTYRWLSLLVWLYVLEGLVRATSESGRGALLAAVEATLAVALFIAATFYIRRRLADGAARREPAA